MHAFDLEAQTADINISGSGKAEVQLVETLAVRVSGSGDVFYQGNPLIDTVYLDREK